MAFTAPADYSVGQVLTAANLNTYLRDNMKAAGEGEWAISVEPIHGGYSNTGWATIGDVATRRLETDNTNQNNEIVFRVPLIDGTWTVSLLHSTGSNRGIYDIQFDGTSKGTIDGYSAGG